MKKQKIKQEFQPDIEISDDKKQDRILITEMKWENPIKVDYDKIPELIEKLKLFVK